MHNLDRETEGTKQLESSASMKAIKIKEDVSWGWIEPLLFQKHGSVTQCAKRRQIVAHRDYILFITELCKSGYTGIKPAHQEEK